MFMNYPQRLRLQQILDSVSKVDMLPEVLMVIFMLLRMDTITIDKRGYDLLSLNLQN
jgi:putative endopeptidase